MINLEDISVIVQGAVDTKYIHICLESIRKYLPGAEIILSTWEGSEVSNLDYDVLILNQDPGAPECLRSDGSATPCNTDRQTVSTVNGLKKSNRKYALKLRSDLCLFSSGFLEYFEKFPLRDEKYSLFKHKVIISSVYTKLTSHINGMPVPYHPTDWLFFGLREDLLTYFDVPMTDEKNFFKWKYKNPLKHPYPNCRDRYFTEQHYFISTFSKKFDLKYDDITCWSDYSINLWKQLLVNNFIVLDFATLNIYSLKHTYFKRTNNGIDKSFKGLVWQSDYVRIYKQIFKEYKPSDILADFKNFFFRKGKTEDKRMIVLFNFIKISYKKRQKHPPLKVPYDKIRLVEIEIFSYCNRRCWFCQNSFIDRHSKNVLMDEKLYSKILNELKSINYNGTVSYSRYNEPFSHIDIFEKRLKEAGTALPKAVLHTNSNGDFVTKETLDRAYNAGLRSLNIQCYLKEDEEFNVENIKQRIIDKAQSLNLEYNFDFEHNDWIQATFKYKDMNIKMYSRDFKINGTNRAGSLKTVPSVKRNCPCFIPFRDIYIDHNGSILPCCNFRSDIKENKKFILGNADKESILKVFNGKNMQKLRKILREDKIKITPCDSCNFAKGFEY